jgi:hypothetical protein
MPAPLSIEDDGAQDDYPGTGSASPPPILEPVSLRRSTYLRKVPIHPSNIYEDGSYLTEVEKDIEWTRTWKDMVNKPDTVAPTSNQSHLRHPLKAFLMALRVRIHKQT